MTSRVSVIVCTYNRESPLRQVLADLLHQDHEPMEILVIDQSLVHEAETDDLLRDRRITRIFAKPPNLPAARNIGIGHARGELVLFADDDLRLPSHLVGHLQSVFRRADIDGWAPFVLPDEEGSLEDVLSLPWSRGAEGSMRRAGYVIGACVAVRRDAIIACGGFDERMGRLNRSAAGEDYEFYRRFVRRGFRLWASNECAVLHQSLTPGGCENRVGEFAGRSDHQRLALIYTILKENDSLDRLRFGALVACLRAFVLRRDLLLRIHSLPGVLQRVRQEIEFVKGFCRSECKSRVSVNSP